MTMTWVVFRPHKRGEPGTTNAVCSQMEWEQMERQNPGNNTLLFSGIANEGEAESLARGKEPEKGKK